MSDLLKFVEAIEAEQANAKLALDSLYSQAKEAGLVPAALRQMIRERKLAADVRADQFAVLQDYRMQLGMLADTPLGVAAIERAAPMPALTFAEQPVHPKRRGRPRRKNVIQIAEHFLGA